jgi:AraC family transcriptional regulator
MTYEVRIVDLEDTRVAALEYRGNRRFIDGAVRKFVEWRRLNNLPPNRSATFTIVHQDAGGDCHYDLCAATGRDLVDDGSGVVPKTIPGGRCAVIRHVGSDDALGEVAAHLHRVWLPRSGERLRAFPMFFRRVRFPPQVPAHEAVTDVHLPLE